VIAREHFSFAKYKAVSCKLFFVSFSHSLTISFSSHSCVADVYCWHAASRLWCAQATVTLFWSQCWTKCGCWILCPGIWGEFGVCFSPQDPKGRSQKERNTRRCKFRIGPFMFEVAFVAFENANLFHVVSVNCVIDHRSVTSLILLFLSLLLSLTSPGNFCEYVPRRICVSVPLLLRDCKIQHVRQQ